MKKLELTFRKSGYDYVQVERGEYAVIYSLSFEGKIVGYEALRILSHNGREIHGNWIPAKEFLPSSEQFGTLAFACKTLGKAKIRFEQLNIKPKSPVSTSV